MITWLSVRAGRGVACPQLQPSSPPRRGQDLGLSLALGFGAPGRYFDGADYADLGWRGGLVHGEINEYQRTMHKKAGRFLPRVAKKLMVKILDRSIGKGITTTFSNLGLVTLPREIEERVEMLEFVLGDEPGFPYLFACIAVGDALTLTTTMSAEGRGITESLIEGLEGYG